MFENHGHLDIHGSLTLTGQEIQMTENQLQGTSPLLEVILLHGEVRSKRLLPYLVQKLSFEESRVV